MKEQNYVNHKRYVIGYHFITFSLSILLLAASIYNMYAAFRNDNDILIAIMFLIVSILFLSLFFYSRLFALKAQDRAIRSEENFRHFILSGKIFDSKIKMSQILALRFAPDEEFIELTKKAVNENLNSREIKQTVKNWKSDHYRV